MLEKLEELFATNENALFMLFITLIVTIIGFFIKNMFFKDKGTITFKDYKKDLKEKEKEVTSKLEQAHDKEKQLLQTELAKIQTKKNNLQQSYEEHIAELKERIAKLEQFKSNDPKLFNKAIDALKQGKNKTADDLFAQIEQNSEDTIKTVAEAAFQRAKIAEDEVRYADALKHYQKAHHLALENTLYLNQLGLIYRTLGKHKEAIRCYELALESDLKTYGKYHSTVANFHNYLGMAWQALG
jgi:tetratricopeptide (TPR) repeat protein